MDRRNFLCLLGAGAAVAAFNPHRVIFDMGRKLWMQEPLDWARYYSVSIPIPIQVDAELEKQIKRMKLDIRRQFFLGHPYAIYDGKLHTPNGDFMTYFSTPDPNIIRCALA